jgi:hypothetical protein
MSQVERLDDLWMIKIMIDESSVNTSPVNGDFIIEEILVKAMTPACAADKWSSHTGRKLRHVSQRGKPESLVQFEAIIEDNLEKYKLQVFECSILV